MLLLCTILRRPLFGLVRVDAVHHARVLPDEELDAADGDHTYDARAETALGLVHGEAARVEGRLVLNAAADRLTLVLLMMMMVMMVLNLSLIHI